MKRLVLLMLLGAITFSCQKKESTEDAAVSTSFENERNAFFSNLRSPAEVAAQLQATAADFNAGLLNNAQTYISYTNNEVKAAANLGIYLADLNYSIAFKQSAYVNDLFTASHHLSQSIGIEQSVLDFLMQRYSDNINQNDSVKAIVEDLFESSTADLVGTERETLVGVAMSAYQIENLHLALGTIEAFPKDMLPEDARIQILMPLFRVVLAQRQNVEIIYGFLKSISDPNDPNKNPNYPYYANAFEELIGVYKNLNVEEKIANNQGMELMNDEVVKQLDAKVDAIRAKIISVE